MPHLKAKNEKERLASHDVAAVCLRDAAIRRLKEISRLTSYTSRLLPHAFTCFEAL